MFAKHNLSKSSSSQNLNDIKLLKVFNIVLWRLSLEDYFRFRFEKNIGLQILLINNNRMNSMSFSFPFPNIDDRCCVNPQYKVIINIKVSWFVCCFSDSHNDGFNIFHLQVDRDKAIVIFFVDMYYYFIAISRSGNSNNLMKRDLSFDSVG